MERLSLKKALKNDYTMTVSLCCILIGGILFFLHDKFGLVISKREIKTDGSIVYSIIPGAIALFGILNAFRRWLRIRGIFERGVTVPATVTNSSFFKDRGRISYRYAYEGSEYRTGLALCRNKVTEAIGGGEKVFVIVDERKPKRSLILSLYSDNEEKPPSSLYTGGQAEQLVAELRRRTALPSLAIHARLADEPLSLTTSKFGGLPYWNPAEAYPVGVDGRKLIMLAQLNMADIPPLEGFPSTGLLQFFIGGGDGLFGLDLDAPTEQKNWRVVYHESMDRSVTDEAVRSLGVPDSRCLSDAEKENFPFEGEFALAFEKAESTISPASDERFIAAVRESADALGLPLPDDSTTAYDLFGEDFYGGLAEQSLGHHLGGYPDFTQYDPRPLSDRHDTLLFQMDSEYVGTGGSPSGEIMWGDMGVANFFISREALLRRDFSDILYNWDCG